MKYLGLLGLHKLMKQHPRVVAEHKDTILKCLNDEDVTIRIRALDLISEMVRSPFLGRNFFCFVCVYCFACFRFQQRISKESLPS